MKLKKTLIDFDLESFEAAVDVEGGVIALGVATVDGTGFQVQLVVMVTVFIRPVDAGRCGGAAIVARKGRIDVHFRRKRSGRLRMLLHDPRVSLGQRRYGHRMMMVMVVMTRMIGIQRSSGAARAAGCRPIAGRGSAIFFVLLIST